MAEARCGPAPSCAIRRGQCNRAPRAGSQPSALAYTVVSSPAPCRRSSGAADRGKEVPAARLGRRSAPLVPRMVHEHALWRQWPLPLWMPRRSRQPSPPGILPSRARPPRRLLPPSRARPGLVPEFGSPGGRLRCHSAVGPPYLQPLPGAQCTSAWAFGGCRHRRGLPRVYARRDPGHRASGCSCSLARRGRARLTAGSGGSHPAAAPSPRVLSPRVVRSGCLPPRPRPPASFSSFLPLCPPLCCPAVGAFCWHQWAGMFLHLVCVIQAGPVPSSLPLRLLLPLLSPSSSLPLAVDTFCGPINSYR